MSNVNFLTGKLRLIIPVQLALFICFSFCAAVSVKAQTGEQPDTQAQGEFVAENTFGIIDTTVVDVQGSVITTAGGILLDASRARFFSLSGQILDLSSIRVGARIRASLDILKDSPSLLVAKFIQVPLDDEVVIVGPLQAVDIATGHITVWNRQIIVNNQTTQIIFNNKRRKLKVGRDVTVIAKSDGTNLVALRIYLDAGAEIRGVGFL